MEVFSIILVMAGMIPARESLSLNTGLQDLSSISPSFMICLQANVSEEAVVLY